MGSPDNKKLSDIVDVVRSWIPWRTQSLTVSRDFWMPDQSCRVCYDCDSQFTLFNRKHHCRLCGRVFCAKCTTNSIPASSLDQIKTVRDDVERIRVCNFCFKQWEQGSLPVDTGASSLIPGLSPSPSATSLVSSQSSSTNKSCSSVGSTSYSTGQFQDKLDKGTRSDDEDEDYRVDYNDISQVHGPHILHPAGERNEPSEQADVLNYDVTGEVRPQYDKYDTDAESLDFENNSQLWHPPEPEDEEDERDGLPLEDDDFCGDRCTGEWGYLHTFGISGAGEQRNRERPSEEHRKAMKDLLDGHFRALISQLLSIENLPASEEDVNESWLDIITSLSWEAATLLKPDMSKSGGMDPGGYVKVKCVACGHRRDSTVVKGVVCKKNVAHRRMTSKFERPRFLILGGALEYQRVSNHLSSFDTLLQQEMDHLKMAVAKIHAHNPNVLLVEKSVSRFAQEYLLEKDISLVLNLKRPLLERIARCTGAQVVPSVDHLGTLKLGYCDSFHVDKFVEEHGSAGQGGKKLTKTLMFFEGCPMRLGCTILLKGANGDELKKVKHVVHYGIFAAYHLALETSFLADERASLPELPLKSPIKVVLPDKPLSTDKSISTISGFPTSFVEKKPCSQSSGGDTSPSSEVKSDFSNECSGKAKNIESSVALYLSRKAFSGEGVFSGFSTQEERHRDMVPCNESSKMMSGLCSDNVGEDSLIKSSCDQKADEHQSLGQGYPDQDDRVVSSKREYSHSDSDHQSILVSLTTHCIWKSDVCERRIFRIKYYGTFDMPLGRFLRDHLFDQNHHCQSCELPPEAHTQCYAHLQGSLTISVRKLKEYRLSGEKEGKVWMWHRCLRCPRINELPPSTRRVVMSDAAWGLSFGKFLELSFSNHVAASRVASCGHSLHRDCLRLYGFSNMVACFHYAPIHVHSVYLPPPKLVFNYDNQDWIQNEVDEVQHRIEILFAEVVKVLNLFVEKICAEDESKARRMKIQFEAKLHGMEIQYEELLQVTHGERKASQLAVDIFEINKLRLKLILQSYTWDQNLMQFANSNNLQNIVNSIPKEMENIVGFGDKSHESRPAKGFSSSDSFLVNKQNPIDQDSSGSKDSETMRRALSEGQFPVNTGSEKNVVESSTGIGYNPSEGMDSFSSDQIGDEQAHLPSSDSSSMLPKDMESSWSRLCNSILNLNIVNSPEGLQEWCKVHRQSFDKIAQYSPAYISSFRDLLHHSCAKFILPVDNNKIVVPVYDDEPTSIISYALTSSEYRRQLFKQTEKPKEGLGSSASLPILASQGECSLSSADEATLESRKDLQSSDENILPLSASRTISNLDSSSYADDSDTKTSFSVDFSVDGLLGMVGYTVNCYYAKNFNELRRTVCPSELDYIRSLSRCKKWGAQGGKSKVFFAKTLDDRFIIKQVTRTELASFIKFAQSYFTYLSESLTNGSPTCLAKILGIYQVTSKHAKSGKESKMDFLVMENLLYRRNTVRLYDLKGSTRSRYNSDSSGSNKVLLDENLLEAMPKSPIFVGTKPKQLLERAVWNDTLFLASIDVMDYSLLAGIDEVKNELVVGIIDFMRQYTWDKQLETWVKVTFRGGGTSKTMPTVISPMQYKKRFRKAMSSYFLMVPEQWPSPKTGKSQSDLCEEDN